MSDRNTLPPTADELKEIDQFEQDIKSQGENSARLNYGLVKCSTIKMKAVHQPIYVVVMGVKVLKCITPPQQEIK